MSLADRNYAEKRDFIRMVVQAPIQFTIPPEQTIYQGMTTNISGNGIQFMCERMLALDTDIIVEVNKTARSMPPLIAKAQVVRTQPHNDKQCLISAKIIEIMST